MTKATKKKLVAVGKFIPISTVLDEFKMSASALARVLRRQFLRDELRALCHLLEIPEGRLKRRTSARIARRLLAVSRGEANYRHLRLSVGVNLRIEARKS